MHEYTNAFCIDSKTLSVWSAGMSDPIRVPIEAEIDLHAFSPQDVRSVVEEYVSAAAAAGLREVRIVHGRGRGVQRGMVQAALERHPQVAEFWDDTAAHLGATFARLTPAR
jgi:DNA-nicking Smr family endonuclease